VRKLGARWRGWALGLWGMTIPLAAGRSATLLAQGGRFVDQGIAVEVSVVPAEGTELKEGGDALVRLRLSDATTGTPLTRTYPAAWMDPVVAVEEQALSCRQRVEGYVAGGMLKRPRVDLNSYRVLTLNDDASISVLDPLSGFGGSQLFTSLFLPAPGEDWALGSDATRLFVSMPEVNRVAVADTETFKVLTSLETGVHPGRVAVQPDGGYLWVAHRGGVDVFDARQLTRVARLGTGAGSHEIAFSDDSRWAFVTNAEARTLSVIDVRRLAKVHDVALGVRPVGVVYSPPGASAWVATVDGSLVAVSPASKTPTARVAVEEGEAGGIVMAPDGRYAFVLHPRHDRLSILDTARRRIVQRAKVESRPDQIVFSKELAYVRHAGSDTVLMIPLAVVGQEGTPVSVIDFTGGQNPLGAGKPSLAAGLAPAPGADAMLVANAADHLVYYYREGMAAPMGSFNNGDRQPRAVLALDRSLREKSPGSYETRVHLDAPGAWNLAFFLSSPRLLHCFPLQVAVDPAIRRPAGPPARAELVDDLSAIAAGKPASIRFKILDSATGEPRKGLKDVVVLAYQPPGTSRHQLPASEVEPGLYEVVVPAMVAGSLYLVVESPGLQWTAQNSPPLRVEIRG
jgi:DNA-binding beta-propeller fold protein YncE